MYEMFQILFFPSSHRAAMRNVFYDINVGETDWFVAAFQTVNNSFVIDPLWCVKAEELENWITEKSD